MAGTGEDCRPCGRPLVELCGCGGDPVTGTDVEGSRPSASGMNANESWADRSRGFTPVSEVGVLRVSEETVISGLSLAGVSSGVRGCGPSVDPDRS